MINRYTRLFSIAGSNSNQLKAIKRGQVRI
jgi:hypothetical protein